MTRRLNGDIQRRRASPEHLVGSRLVGMLANLRQANVPFVVRMQQFRIPIDVVWCCPVKAVGDVLTCLRTRGFKTTMMRKTPCKKLLNSFGCGVAGVTASAVNGL